jgi:hypothetical protein
MFQLCPSIPCGGSSAPSMSGKTSKQVAIDEHRPGADLDDHVHRRKEALRRRDDFIAGLDPAGEQGQFHRARCKGQGARRAAAERLRQRAFEFQHARAARDSA